MRNEIRYLTLGIVACFPLLAAFTGGLILIGPKSPYIPVREMETTYNGERVHLAEKRNGDYKAVFLDRPVLSPWGSKYMTLVDKDRDLTPDYVSKGTFLVGRPPMYNPGKEKPTLEQITMFQELMAKFNQNMEK